MNRNLIICGCALWVLLAAGAARRVVEPPPLPPSVTVKKKLRATPVSQGDAAAQIVAKPVALLVVPTESKVPYFTMRWNAPTNKGVVIASYLEHTYDLNHWSTVLSNQTSVSMNCNRSVTQEFFRVRWVCK